MKRIGIIGAMEVEVATLIQAVEVCQTVDKANMRFYQGKLKGQEVVLVKSGIGKVNAAVCTQILVDDFKVETIINTGIAGSLKAEIDIGDIVISTDLVHHDMNATGFGYPAGQIPQMDIFSFPADEDLADLAQQACEEVNPTIKVFRGRIVSGDQFVSDQAVKEVIVKNFGGYCTEMEGAAIAQAAWLNNIPCVVIRAISDKADNSATMDYPTFEAIAVKHSVRLVEKFLDNIN